MQDIQTQLQQLNRPQLLLRAANSSQDKYKRNRDLKRVLQLDETPRTPQALLRLLDLERLLNHQRQCDSFAYSFAQHIEILIALRAEAALYFSDLRNKKGDPSPEEPPDIASEHALT